MHRKLIKKKYMSKFDKLVELAKANVEDYIIRKNECSNIVFLPTKTEDLIAELGGEWYFNILLRAGYSHKTIDRKIDKMDFAKLENAIDDWYKTEMYPKLYNEFQSEGREILDY